MKYILFLGLFFGMLSVNAQEQSAKLSFESLLSPGEFLSFNNKSIRFKEVISDSRCPKDVTCIWAGEAKVLVEVFENGKQLEEKIISLKEAANFTFSFGDSDSRYSLKDLELYPYPTSKHKIAASDYCLKIKLSEE